MVKKALNDEFEIIFAREDKMIAHILEKIRTRHKLSCFFPVLFYNSVHCEVSSCGGLSFIDFYNFSKQRKKEFILFYVEKKFLTKSKPGQVESFVKKDENLFYAQSHLPYWYWWGVLFSLIIYIGGGGIAAYFCFKHSLRRIPGKGSTEKVYMKMNSGEDIYIKTCDNSPVEYLYNVLSGDSRGFEGQILIDKTGIAANKKHDFVYICSPDDIPGEVTVMSLMHLINGLLALSKDKVKKLKTEFDPDLPDNKFMALEADERAKILFKLVMLKDSETYLFHELVDKCSKDLTLEVEKQVKVLLSRGRLVIYISQLPFPNPHLNVGRFFVVTKKKGKYETKEIS